MAENPYLPDKGQQLAMLLMSLGGGFSQAGAAGRPAWEGIAPGAAMFSNGLMQSQQMGVQRQMHDESADLRKRSFALQEAEFKDKHDERNAKKVGMQAWATANAPGADTPGMGPPPVQPTMGPQNYDARTAGLEGGSKNGGFVYNELGSGAFGPYQFMPGTWADVRAKNPDLNLPADMTKAGGDQHKAAFDAFSKGNAAILQQSGIQPTPENLYLAHRFGAGGATTMLRADPNALLSDVLPADWQRQNPDMRGQTVGGFKRLAGERMQGVGMPYQASGEQTSMALQPSSLPAFAGAGMPNFQPGATPMPQFSGRAVPTSGPQVAQVIPQGDAETNGMPPRPADAAPPTQPPQVPKPMLSTQEYASIRAVAQTPKEAEELKHKLINEKWSRAQSAADKAWQVQHENYRFSRGQDAEAQRHERNLQTDGEFIRGADGVERFVSRADRKPGMTRVDKPPAAGTETGDVHILNNGDPSSREYAGAYNRVRTKLVDGPDGFKYAPDMDKSGHRPPTFREPGAAPGSGSPAPASTESGLPGLVPVGAGKERKYTESQGKDHTYAIRLDNAIPQLEALVKGPDGKYSTDRLPSSYERMKGDSDFVPDSMVSDRAKEFRGIVKDIVTSTLRRESGASIAASEFKSEMQKFIPLPGDNDSEIRRKLGALKIAARSIAEGSGRPLTTYKNLHGSDTGNGDAPTEKKAPIRIDMSGRRQ